MMRTIEELAAERIYQDPPTEPMSTEILRIACQGTEGAYSQLTARKLFPNGIFLYFRSFEAVADAVRAGLCDYGVLPIENNTYGSVKDVYRVLTEKEVHILRGHKMRIRHELLAKPGTKLSNIHTVLSHEQALGQCDRFLRTLGDQVRIEAAINTAVAARKVAESEDPGLAAISSPECVSLYSLSVLRRNIADNDHNYTRFICISKEEAYLPGADRISLIISLPHVPGSLSDILSRFSEAGVNLLKIESAPIPGKNFEFLFYLDLEASLEDPGIRELLAEISVICPAYTFLGNYPED